jgi:hypothetical protein
MSGEKLGRILNFNVGVLGHVDSGKTSLARALSTVASTAAFDKVRRFQKNRRENPIKLESCQHNAPVPCFSYLSLLDTCRLIRHGAGSIAQRMSVHGCGQHSYPVLLHLSKCRPPLLLGGFCSHFMNPSRRDL